MNELETPGLGTLVLDRGWVSIAVIKAVIKSNGGGGQGLFRLTGCSLSLREVRAGTDAETLEECCSLACSAWATQLHVHILESHLSVVGNGSRCTRNLLMKRVAPVCRTQSYTGMRPFLFSPLNCLFFLTFAKLGSKTRHLPVHFLTVGEVHQ